MYDLSAVKGLNVHIYTYDCEGSTPRRCHSFQFVMGTEVEGTMSSAAINQWNEDKRYASASLSSEGAVFLRMNALTQGEVTEANIAEQFQIWELMLGSFIEYVGENQ